MIHFVVTLKGRVVGRFDVEGDRVRIGRHPDNEVQIDNRGVSRFHTLLRREETGQWLLEDQGSHNGTFVNGARVKTKVLRDGDVVGVGQFSVSIKTDGAGSPTHTNSTISVRPGNSPEALEAKAPQKGYLEFLDRSGHILVNRDLVQLGSAPGLDVHLDGPSKAVLIVRGYGGFQLVNVCHLPVTVGGEEVRDRIWLHNGAQIQVGGEQFTFYSGLPSEDAGTMQIEVPRSLRPPPGLDCV
jgi:pSer/pThr/pTyr-binding forkhead associated (FHA) protein